MENGEQEGGRGEGINTGQARLDIEAFKLMASLNHQRIRAVQSAVWTFRASDFASRIVKLLNENDGAASDAALTPAGQRKLAALVGQRMRPCHPLRPLLGAIPLAETEAAAPKERRQANPKVGLSLSLSTRAPKLTGLFCLFFWSFRRARNRSVRNRTRCDWPKWRRTTRTRRWSSTSSTSSRLPMLRSVWRVSSLRVLLTRHRRSVQVLKKTQERNERRPVPYYHFVVDPHSFTNTVENIFYASFLIKDGFVALRDGPPPPSPTLLRLKRVFPSFTEFFWVFPSFP